MKSLPSHVRKSAGISLVETMVGVAIASIVLGALMVGTIALQRAFAASDSLASAQADLIRAGDYMTRDIRNSLTMTTGTSPAAVLTLTTGDYFDRKGKKSNAQTPNSPTLELTRAVYGDSPVTIRYFLTTNRVRREVTNSDGVTNTWIAENVNSLAVSINAGIAIITSTATTGYRIPKPGAAASTLSLVMAARPRNS